MEDVLYDNDSFFDNSVGIESLSQDSEYTMKLIDNATLRDKKTGTIVTPYGTCSVKSLSTGCKTVLNCIYLNENKEELREENLYFKAINATECGWNALEVLFDYVDKKEVDINIIVEHRDGLWRCSKRDYVVNNKHMIRDLLWIGQVE